MKDQLFCRFFCCSSDNLLYSVSTALKRADRSAFPVPAWLDQSRIWVAAAAACRELPVDCPQPVHWTSVSESRDSFRLVSLPVRSGTPSCRAAAAVRSPSDSEGAETGGRAGSAAAAVVALVAPAAPESDRSEAALVAPVIPESDRSEAALVAPVVPESDRSEAGSETVASFCAFSGSGSHNSEVLPKTTGS